MDTGLQSRRIRERKKREQRRRRRTLMLIAAHIVAAGVVVSVLVHNRVQARAKEQALFATWQKESQGGLPAKDLKALQVQLADAQKPGRRLLAPWDGYDAALTKLSAETKQRWQHEIAAARKQAAAALTSYQKSQSSWGDKADQSEQHKLANAQTPVEFQQLTAALTKDNRDWQSQVKQLQHLGGGLLHNRPADVVTAQQKLQALLKDNGDGMTDAAQANATRVLAETKHYLSLTPAAEIQQHKTQLAALNGAIAQVPVVINPFDASFQSYVASRQSQVSVAVYDGGNGRTYNFHPELTFGTASIVKATIMADLLHQSQESGTPLTSTEQKDMVPMIENSDNDAASDLWDIAGEAQGVEGFLEAAGMDETVPGQDGYWGLTTTTASDQVALMKLYAYPNDLLDNASRAYGLNLMEHITSWEDWGVSAGPTSGTTVALKNGWSPAEADDWRINSIGYIDGDGRNYVVAVLSQNNPTEQYGIDTVDEVSQYIWDALGEGD